MEDEDISLGLNSAEELVSVQGQDGQQYVVLEVIQLEASPFFFFLKKKKKYFQLICENLFPPV